MTTVGEERFRNAVASSLNRIANCMEAEEKRKRRMETGGWAPVEQDPEFTPTCSLCGTAKAVEVNGTSYCLNHVEEAFKVLGDAVIAANRMLRSTP